MNKTTKSLHTKVDTQLAHPAVTPLYQNSAFESQSEFFYSRKNNHYWHVGHQSFSLYTEAGTNDRP